MNQFLERKRKTSLSGPALETLAIIAYKQPITRVEIEAIRGVVVDGVIRSLLDKRLIRVAGVKEAPGRPRLYRTTKKFLEYFGIGSLNDLPPIENISETYSSGMASSEENSLENNQNSQDESASGEEADSAPNPDGSGTNDGPTEPTDNLSSSQ